jgi:hypothetical protein
MGLYRIKQMRIKLTLSTDDGRSYEGEVELTAVGGNPKKPATRKKSPPPSTLSPQVDFTLPLRALVAASNARKLSGPKKFVLLLSALAKGDTSAVIDVDRIQKEWNKMKAPMGGGFNGAYVTRAKDKGWIDSTKPGVYTLRSTWEEAFK